MAAQAPVKEDHKQRHTASEPRVKHVNGKHRRNANHPTSSYIPEEHRRKRWDPDACRWLHRHLSKKTINNVTQRSNEQCSMGYFAPSGNFLTARRLNHSENCQSVPKQYRKYHGMRRRNMRQADGAPGNSAPSRPANSHENSIYRSFCHCRRTPHDELRYQAANKYKKATRHDVRQADGACDVSDSVSFDTPR